MPARSLSRSVEDYLKAIYSLTTEEQSASTSAIAAALDIQPASVTGMVKRMAEDGLLEHAPYRGVRLTGAGVAEALKVLRRHRILESYLCERLGFSWDDVHEEAERLEHAASDRLIEQMARALGFPSHDPHGAPIPTRSGDIEARIESRLADSDEGTRVRIHRVRDEDADGLRAMAALGLVPGTAIRIAGRVNDDISVDVEGGSGRTSVVVQALAEQIFVVPADD